MSHTIVATHLLWPDAHQMLEESGTVIEWDRRYTISTGDLLLLMPDADALICSVNDRIDRQIITAGRRLRVVCTLSSETSHIDLDAAAEFGIFVCNTPGAAEEAIADMTLALLLTCARHITLADHAVKSGDWQYWEPSLFLGADVQGRTLGIIGLGNIGLLVAHRALGFGMRVLYADPHRNHDAEQRLGIQYGSMENLLRESDFVTLHAPLNEHTRGMINAERLALMKPSAYLINVTHGELVNRQALLQALQEQRIAGAGLDVFDEEPLNPEDPLLTLGNVVLTPHIAANSVEGVHTMMRMAVQQVIDTLNGKIPENAVVIPKGKAA